MTLLLYVKKIEEAESQMKIVFSTTLALAILLLFTLVPVIAQEGTDETEPNNTRAKANEIDGLTISGTVGNHDQADWYILNGQEGSNPTITLTYDTSQCDIDMDIYSDNDLAGSLTDTGSPDSGTFSIPGTCYLEVFAHSGYGNYTIDIKPEGSNQPAPQINHHANSNCEGVDETEPNDTQDTANEIDGLEFEGYACKVTDSTGTQIGEDDWFILNGQEGDNPKITLAYNDGLCDIDADIYSDNTLVGSLNSATSPEEDSFQIPGTCYIDVYAYQGEGSYTVTITPAPNSVTHHGHGANGDTGTATGTHTS